MVEGRRLVDDAIAAGLTILEEYTAPGVPARTKAPHHVLAPGVLERVSDTEQPQGVVVLARRPTDTALPEGDAFVMVVDRIADPGNLGTILRSAEAAGVDAVVTTPGTTDAFAPKVVRASAGALFHLPILELEVHDLAAGGYRVVAASSHRGVPYRGFDYGGRVALVVGNEAGGVDETAAISTWVRIPHHGRAESLNVAMAATLLCFAAAESRAGPAS